jgi:large subunit ribosomal protein L25
MASTVQLQGKSRTGSGKGAARRLRASRRVPGVLYGKGMEPVLFEMDSRDFLRALSGQAASTLVVDFTLEGQSPAKTLIRELQVDPLTGELLHVDLNRISLTEKIEIEVPLDIQGVAAGVKNFGGILSHPVRTVTIRCFADKIPSAVRIDVTALNIGDTIKVKDLDLEGIDIVTDRETTLAGVLPPTQEEAAKPAAPAASAEPELVGKKEEKAEEETEKKEGAQKEKKA